MAANFIAKSSINIHASTTKVWEALTDPKLIKQYFFGTDAISDWKVGSPLLFKGEWEGKAYVDKGFILRSEAPKLFQYSYLSSFSGLEDKPENYANITYELTDEGDNETTLLVKQENNISEEASKSAERNWSQVLTSLKSLLEKN